MAGVRVINLADIYGKAQQHRANEQLMQLQDLKMQEAAQAMKQKQTLKDLVMSSYTPASPAVPFEADEEAFMGQPSLTGLTAKPAVRGGMNYDKLAQGLAGMGDFESMMKVQEAKTESGSKVSKAHQEKATAAQKFVDAGDVIGLEQFIRADDETPDDVKVTSVNEDGSMTMTSASWPQPRTIKPSLNAQKFGAKAGGADPYFSPVQTGGGLYAFDHRTASVNPIQHNGQTLLGSVSDPRLQGNISRAKEFGKVAGETEGITTVKKPQQGKDTLSLLNDVDSLITNATGSMIGAGRDAVAGAFGHATPGAAATAKLKVIQAGLMANMPRMEGPQSDKDVALYREAAGQIGDPTIPADMKKAAVETIRIINRKYVAQGQPGQSFQEGATRTNRRTGEVQVFRGGQWQRQ